MKALAPDDPATFHSSCLADPEKRPQIVFINGTTGLPTRGHSNLAELLSRGEFRLKYAVVSILGKKFQTVLEVKSILMARWTIQQGMV